MKKPVFQLLLSALLLLLICLSALAHVSEGTGQALQLFSYRATGTLPVIDGSPFSRDGDPSVKDDMDEWKEAYVRKITLEDNTQATILFMNTDDTLYVAVNYEHGNNSDGSGVYLYFDEGTGGGNHNDALTGSASLRNEDGCFVDKSSSGDLSWNGSSWQADGDGQSDFNGARYFFNDAVKVHTHEFAIPLNNSKSDDTDDSDLDVNTSHELGILVRVQKHGSGAGSYCWNKTNGDSSDAGTGNGWADLQLNVNAEFSAFYSAFAANGNPTVDGSLSDDAWRGSYLRDIILTNFEGDTVGARFYSVQHPTNNDVYVGLKIYDGTSNASDYAQIYFEENAADNTTKARDFDLDDGFEDATRATGATATDIYWNSNQWSTDSEGADNHDAEGSHKTTHYEYEFIAPYDAGAQDIDIPDDGNPGMLIRFYDADKDAGKRNFYWEYTTNTDSIQIDPNGNTYLALGWANLQLGAPYAQIVNPEDGATVSGAFHVRVYVTDGTNTADSVKYFLKDVSSDTLSLIRIDGENEWAGTWNTTVKPDGDYTLVVRVFDGNITLDRLVDITINNSGTSLNQPTVSITSPSASDTVSGSVTINFTASVSGGSIDTTQISVDGGAYTATTTSSTHTWSTSSLHDGAHTLRMRVVDNNGQSAKSEPVLVHTLNAPTVTITTPAADSTVRDTTVLRFTILPVSPATVGDAWVSIDGGAYTAATTDSTHTLATNTLTDGSHTLKIKGTDSNGKIAYSETRKFKVNNAPIVTVTSPAADSTVRDTAIIRFTVSTVSSASIDTVWISIDGGAYAATTTDSSHTLPTNTLTDGAHTLVIKALDSNGKTATSNTLKFNVENAPIVTISSPQADSTVAGTIVIQFSVSTISSVSLDSTWISIDGADYRATSTGSTDTLDTQDLTEGTHTLRIKARDSNGKTSESVIRVFNVKNAPTVAVSSPTGDSTVSGTLVIEFTATPVSPATVSSTEISVNGGGWRATSTSTRDTIDTQTMTDGSHIFQVRATDNNGKIGYSRIIKIVVKNSPTITLSVPAADTLVNGLLIVQFTATPVSPATISSTEISVDGAAWRATSTSTTDSIQTATLRDGAHTIVVRATDNNSKQGISQTRQFKIDNTPPSIPAPEIAYIGSAGMGRKGTQVLVSVTGLDLVAGMHADSAVQLISDALDTARIEVFLNDTGASGDEIKGDGVYSGLITVNTDSSGSMSYTIIVRDKLGNSDTLVSAIGLDNVVPRVDFSLDPVPEKGPDSLHGESYVAKLIMKGVFWDSGGSGLQEVLIEVRNDSGHHVNNSPLELSSADTAFSRIINLVEGMNHIYLFATDRAGNRDSLKAEVTYIVPKVTQMVTTSGATVTSPNKSAVVIPEKALFGGTEVTMRVVDPDEEPKPLDEGVKLMGIPHEFGPDGIVFRKPVTITLAYTEADLDKDQDGTRDFGPEKLAIYFWDGESWLRAGEPSVDTANKLVSVVVNHFTMYDIGEDSQPPPTELNAYWKRNPLTKENGSTFEYELPKAGTVSLMVFDLAGDLVRTLIGSNTSKGVGYHSEMWRGDNVVGQFSGAGLYIYVFVYKSDDGSITEVIRKPLGLLKN